MDQKGKLILSEPYMKLMFTFCTINNSNYNTQKGRLIFSEPYKFHIGFLSMYIIWFINSPESKLIQNLSLALLIVH